MLAGWNGYPRDKGEEMKEQKDICGLCGKDGADKYAAPIHWPGEEVPDSELVHAECEANECQRAHSVLSDAQRSNFLKTI